MPTAVSVHRLSIDPLLHQPLKLDSHSLNELPPNRIRTLNGTKHQLFRDRVLHIPDRLTRRTRQLRNTSDLLVSDVWDAQLSEGDRKIHREHEREVDVELGRGCAGEEKLRDRTECDFLPVQKMVEAGDGCEAVMDLHHQEN